MLLHMPLIGSTSHAHTHFSSSIQHINKVTANFSTINKWKIKRERKWMLCNSNNKNSVNFSSVCVVTSGVCLRAVLTLSSVNMCSRVCVCLCVCPLFLFCCLIQLPLFFQSFSVCCFLPVLTVLLIFPKLFIVVVVIDDVVGAYIDKSNYFQFFFRSAAECT